ncbi:hypothetical protein KSP40_PGU002473 [Platanthera guangdongensis]|uniref:VLRF1 domain-containing protein n=2 Tax=Platanthera guangdongensis TaxID=2320717 RepID=A0ABR2MK29_9ASPA
MAAAEKTQREQKFRSLFDLPSDFFESCRLLLFHHSLNIPKEDPSPSPQLGSNGTVAIAEDVSVVEESTLNITKEKVKGSIQRWACNTCKLDFESLQEQRFHFKSDIHRLNIKLSVAGKNIVNEEEFDEQSFDSSFDAFDVSSISGSEDEIENGVVASLKTREGVKQKLHIRLHSGEIVSVWRTLILDEAEDVTLDDFEVRHAKRDGSALIIGEDELTRRLKDLLSEPRDRTHLRIVLLLTGGHFAGCVFDGNSIIAHKTFHRYVVRAKSGKKQSTKDGTGKSAHSAGSSLRRYNEAALKKEIQDLLVTWKSYINSSQCIFFYAPSRNRQILFDGEKQNICFHDHVFRHIPLTIRRPTLKEAKRVYLCLTQLSSEVDEKGCSQEVPNLHTVEGRRNEQFQVSELIENLEVKTSDPPLDSAVEHLPSDLANISLSHSENISTLLHAAAQSGNAPRTLELLEQGCSPCLKDERGRTPYMLATEKEVRNTFRRFMAENLDRWDWQAAHVPSPLTKEVEESQAVKQAEKDAKRKAKAKELKKLRKAKEKAKMQAQETASQDAPTAVPQNHTALRAPPSKQPPQLRNMQINFADESTVRVAPSRQQPSSSFAAPISKEEEEKKALAEEREKRAGAAERRIAAMQNKGCAAGFADDIPCSCCNASLAGKIPFHRYHYKYCSTTCMHIHREILEDG